jgi:hypothetical protein
MIAKQYKNKTTKYKRIKIKRYKIKYQTNQSPTIYIKPDHKNKKPGEVFYVAENPWN